MWACCPALEDKHITNQQVHLCRLTFLVQCLYQVHYSVCYIHHSCYQKPKRPVRVRTQIIGQVENHVSFDVALTPHHLPLSDRGDVQTFSICQTGVLLCLKRCWVKRNGSNLPHGTFKSGSSIVPSVTRHPQADPLTASKPKSLVGFRVGKAGTDHHW